MPTPDTDVVPPAACPATYQTQMGSNVSCPAATIMAQHKVPWCIIKEMVTQEYTSHKELAERWIDKHEARNKAPKDLKYDSLWDEEKRNLYSLRISHAVEAATTEKQNTLTQQLEELPKEKRVIKDKDRETLLTQTQAQHKLRDEDLPKRSEQGSDKYVALQYLEISKGQVGDFKITQIAPYKTDHSKQRKTTNKTTQETDAHGYTRTVDEEFTPPPQDLDQWKLTMKIFRWTLLMCLSAFPEQTRLQITKKELDSYYDWLYGDEIADRPQNKPSVAKLRYAERCAWSRITDILWDERHLGTTLPQAIKKIQSQTLWWTSMLGQTPYPDSNTNHTPKGTGKDKTKNGGKDKSKGGKSTSKGNGKTKSSKGKGNKNQTFTNRLNAHPPPPTQPTGTAYDRPPRINNPIKCTQQQFTKQTEPRNGKPYCWNYHFRSCKGGCNRSHNCPYESNGKVCNARPGHCNHRFN